MVVLLCVLSRTLKKGYGYIRIAAYVVFVAQVLVQIMLGSTFEESVCIWLCELFVALITSKKIVEGTKIVKEEKVEETQEESNTESTQDTKEETP